MFVSVLTEREILAPTYVTKNQDIEHALADAQKKFATGHSDEATCLLRGILVNAPDHGDALEGLGYIAARQGDYVRAAEYLIRAPAHLPMSVERLNFASQVCQLGQRHDVAIALLEHCLVQVLNQATSLHGAAMSLIQLGEPQRALEVLVHPYKI